MADIDDLLTRIERVIAALNERLGIGEEDGEPDEPKVDWGVFVAEHPELAPEPLTFTDDELIAALAEAEKQWAAKGQRYAGRGSYAHCVTRVLHDAPILGPNLGAKGDVIRVGRALARLGREGRVFLTSRSWESKRWSVGASGGRDV
jgi:hypothetical protein